MRNGIYLFLILFLGIMGYFMANDLYAENSTTLAGALFLLVSVVIAYLTTHFKKKSELIPAQKVLNVVYLTIFAIYGIITGLSLVLSQTMELALVRVEGIMFILASAVIIYGIVTFIKQHTHHGHFV